MSECWHYIRFGTISDGTISGMHCTVMSLTFDTTWTKLRHGQILDTHFRQNLDKYWTCCPTFVQYLSGHLLLVCWELFEWQFRDLLGPGTESWINIDFWEHKEAIVQSVLPSSRIVWPFIHGDMNLKTAKLDSNEAIKNQDMHGNNYSTIQYLCFRMFPLYIWLFFLVSVNVNILKWTNCTYSLFFGDNNEESFSLEWYSLGRQVRDLIGSSQTGSR